MIAGPNGSGKSSLITASGIDDEYDSIINPDNYARESNIPDEYERYAAAMRMCSLLRDKLLASRVTFGFETVASRPNKWISSNVQYPKDMLLICSLLLQEVRRTVVPEYMNAFLLVATMYLVKKCFPDTNAL